MIRKKTKKVRVPIYISQNIKTKFQDYKDCLNASKIDATKQNTKVHNPNWPHIPDNPCRIEFVGG